MAAALKAEMRNEHTKSHLKRLRRSGRIPGVVYGNDVPNQPIHLDQTQFLQVIRENGKNHIIQLTMINGEPLNVMISEIQRNPLKNEYLHVDFKSVNMNEPVYTSVPITFIGQAQGVKDGGVLQSQMRELEIRCLPSQIPDSIPLYVSDLAIGDSLTVADIEIPAGIEVQHESEEVIVSIIAPRLNPVEEDEDDTIQEPEVVNAVDGPGLDEAK